MTEEKIRQLLESIDSDIDSENTFKLAYDLLNIEAQALLSKGKEKERKTTDWLEYFIRGYFIGLMYERNREEEELDE